MSIVSYGRARCLSFAGVALAAVLAGCSSVPGVATATGSAKSLYATLTGQGGDNAARKQLKVRVDAPNEPVCPDALVKPGQASFTLYEKRSAPDPKSVAYQGTLTRAARECTFLAGTLNMKYGFAGRVVVGPRGGAGKVVLPVQVTFMKDAREAVWTKEFKITVDVPEGARSADFVHVVDNTPYQIPAGDTLQTHQLQIYFKADEAAPVAASTGSQPLF